MFDVGHLAQDKHKRGGREACLLNERERKEKVSGSREEREKERRERRKTGEQASKGKEALAPAGKGCARR